jgi:hypothetical protein
MANAVVFMKTVTDRASPSVETDSLDEAPIRSYQGQDENDVTGE